MPNFFILALPNVPPRTWNTGNGYLEFDDTWICQNPGTLDEVFRRPLAGLVCAHRTCHRRTSIEDSVVRAGELSPRLDGSFLNHMVN
ncbi:unnamed protein product [Prunus armeniaca]